MQRFNRHFSLRRLGREEDGQAMVLFALLLVVLLGFAALVVDVGLMTASKSKLQKAADAAALAAALEAPPLFRDGGFSGDEITIENIIINRGEEYAEKNGVPKANTEVDWRIVQDPETSKYQNEVQVDVHEQVNHLFARVLGFDSTKIEATATAVRYATRDGSVIPIININNQPDENGKIEIRDKSSDTPSDREWIDIAYYMKEQGVTRIEDLVIDPRENLEIEKGGTQVWMDYVETLLQYPGPHFVFSIRFDIIAALPSGSGIGIYKNGVTPSTGLLKKNDNYEDLKQSDVIAPFARLVDEKYVACKETDSGAVAQIVIIELTEGSTTGGSGANMVVSGPYVTNHEMKDFYENSTDEETELGLSKSRLTK
ncbi:MAG: pilus assembly protein TadG-related protein [Eubacteriales bacterium]|nr:pilus assembly protein TadG-related protein [Eubacteriales bacterium]MDD4324630.1 pilus assembly protein TadG-related protein [Eubacteriales bacterium]MDD4541158.1 pilus assembly protein TadG-related protein [Eubacteriales bacterium]